jgi:hypothetical protein
MAFYGKAGCELHLGLCLYHQVAGGACEQDLVRQYCGGKEIHRADISMKTVLFSQSLQD